MKSKVTYSADFDKLILFLVSRRTKATELDVAADELLLESRNAIDMDIQQFTIYGRSENARKVNKASQLQEVSRRTF